MTMRVRITEPSLLPDLVDRLLRSGCVAHVVGDDSCIVVHVHARDAEEAWREMAFFVRAWHAQHPDLGALLTR
jgi:arginine repressor